MHTMHTLLRRFKSTIKKIPSCVKSMINDDYLLEPFEGEDDIVTAENETETAGNEADRCSEPRTPIEVYKEIIAMNQKRIALSDEKEIALTAEKDNLKRECESVRQERDEECNKRIKAEKDKNEEMNGRKEMTKAFFIWMNQCKKQKEKLSAYKAGLKKIKNLISCDYGCNQAVLNQQILEVINQCYESDDEN